MTSPSTQTPTTLQRPDAQIAGSHGLISHGPSSAAPSSSGPAPRSALPLSRRAARIAASVRRALASLRDRLLGDVATAARRFHEADYGHVTIRHAHARLPWGRAQVMAGVPVSAPVRHLRVVETAQ